MSTLLLEAPRCAGALALFLSAYAEDLCVESDPADESEWVSCLSATRYYVALNETLGEEELVALVLDWLESVEAACLVSDYEQIVAEGLRVRWMYRAWREAMDALHDQGVSWVTYVRREHPRAAQGFAWIGRDANESRKYRASAIGPHRYLGGEE